MFKFFAAALAVLPLALAAPTDSAPAPPGFNITGLGLNGSGCPSGSSYYALNNDNTAVTVTFSQYFAEAGPSVPISSNRRNCQLTFNVHIPPGFTFGVATIDYRGYYQLDDKVTADQQAIYYFQGVLTQATAHSTLTGPVDGDDYTYRDAFDLYSTNLAPCGKDTVLNIQSDVRVSNSKNTQGSGYIATDSVDTALSTTFNFQWLTCQK
ncbi:secreted protein [Pluteus cervinus]|uniref:Secreted protein n=1 Tax=Pluteus cervinus TaxID=181527 RepID=A0ACD3B3G3_9AGAR|nr:secreted protein [Pluteus cervinus]